MNDLVNINKVLSVLNDEMHKLKMVCDEISNTEVDYEDTEGLRNIICLLIGSISDFVNDWDTYNKTYKLAVDLDVKKAKDKVEEITAENLVLKERIKNLELDNKKLVEDIKSVFVDNRSIVDRANELLDAVEKRVGSIAMSRKMKEYTDRSGEKSPVYRRDIDNEDIIKDYKEAGYKVTREMCMKYDTTAPTIIYRLKNLGVYVTRNNKKENQS